MCVEEEAHCYRLCIHVCVCACPDFYWTSHLNIWLLPLLGKKCFPQRKSRESTVQHRRGNSSPTTLDLSDGNGRQHLVIVSFEISFLLLFLRPFVIIFYNRMSNLPLAGYRECLLSPPSPLSFKYISTSLHCKAWPLDWPTIWPSLLSLLISLLSFRCQVKPCISEIHDFHQKFSKKTQCPGS